jgi:hypothetical protein
MQEIIQYITNLRNYMLHCPLWTKLLCQELEVLHSSFPDGENLKLKLQLTIFAFTYTGSGTSEIIAEKYHIEIIVPSSN